MVAAVPSQKKRRRIERRFILLRRFSPSFLRPYSLREEEDDVDGDNNETASLPFPSLPFPSHLFVFNFSTLSASLLEQLFVLFFSSSRVKISRASRRIVPRNGDVSDAGTRRERILKHRSPPIERNRGKGGVSLIHEIPRASRVLDQAGTIDGVSG